MTVRVRAYLKGMKRKEQLRILGTETNVGWNTPLVLLTFNHIGTGISIQEALDMGLTDNDLRAAEEGPQEFGIKLFKPEKAQNGDKNKRLIKRLQEALAPKGLWIDDFSDVPLDRPIKIWRPDVNEGFLGEGDTIEEAFENAEIKWPREVPKKPASG